MITQDIVCHVLFYDIKLKKLYIVKINIYCSVVESF